MSNSPLVDYTQLSPNHSGQRTHAIDRITPHCVVGQLSVETMGGWFAQKSAQCSCNYDIGSDGRVGLVVEQKNRSWCSSSKQNDQRAVTIQCASDKTDPYAINNTVYNKLIELCVDICRRNGKNVLLWFGDKNKTLNYEPKSNEMVITVHRWFAAKACPGDFIYNRLGTIASEVTKRLGGKVEEIKYKVRLTWDNEKSQKGAFVNLEKAKECADANPGYTVFDLSGKGVYTSKGLPSIEGVIAAQNRNKSIAFLATLPDYKGLPASKEDYLNKVAEIAVKLYPYTRILPSVVIAQACLQNGFGVASDAIQLTKRSNLIGQKADLINSTWQDQTVWDGQKFSKKTPEVYNGVPTTITDWFRIFPNYAYSILDYELFLTHVKRTATQYKYREVVGMTDPEKVITTIRNNGYATGVTYITNNMRIINQYGLTKYDQAAFKALQEGSEATIPVVPTPAPATNPTPAENIQYKVGTAISASGVVSNQIGAFVYLEKAKEYCDMAGIGYKVFRMSDKAVVYEVKSSGNKVEDAVQWALNVANDAKYGYDQANRWGPDYDCSSFVITAFQSVGIKVKTAGATYTGDMYPAFTKCGFKDVTSTVNLNTGAGLVRGDVLLNKVKHTAIYIGDGKLVHASRNEKGGATGGATGDQDGKEICIRDYYNSPWDCVLRYDDGSSVTPSPAKKTVYRVQVGVFSTEKKKNELTKAIKDKLDLDCFFESKSDGIHVYCGSFNSEKAAKTRSNLLRKNNFDTEIKTAQVQG